MHELEETLHELCEVVEGELEKANAKIRKSGGELTSGDIDYLDKLTHMMKSIKTTAAMLEGGYSYDGDGGSSYARRGRYSRDDGSSYARGRGTYAKRDSMGRYSREGGYSRAEDEMDSVVEELRSMMGSLPKEKQMEVEKFIRKVEQM